MHRPFPGRFPEGREAAVTEAYAAAGGDPKYLPSAAIFDIFAAVGIFKVPSGAISLQKRARRTPFRISTGRGALRKGILV